MAWLGQSASKELSQKALTAEIAAGRPQRARRKPAYELNADLLSSFFFAIGVGFAVFGRPLTAEIVEKSR
jgi:hypothetical protein